MMGKLGGRNVTRRWKNCLKSRWKKSKGAFGKEPAGRRGIFTSGICKPTENVQSTK